MLTSWQRGPRGHLWQPDNYSFFRSSGSSASIKGQRMGCVRRWRREGPNQDVSMVTKTAGVKIKGPVTVVMCWGPLCLCTLFTFSAPAPFHSLAFCLSPSVSSFPIRWPHRLSVFLLPHLRPSLSHGPIRCLALSPRLSLTLFTMCHSFSALHLYKGFNFLSHASCFALWIIMISQSVHHFGRHWNILSYRRQNIVQTWSPKDEVSRCVIKHHHQVKFNYDISIYGANEQIWSC